MQEKRHYFAMFICFIVINGPCESDCLKRLITSSNQDEVSNTHKYHQHSGENSIAYIIHAAFLQLQNVGEISAEVTERATPSHSVQNSSVDDCNVQTCIDRCTKSTVYCDKEKNICVCKGKSEEAGDASFQTGCTQVGKMWRTKCSSNHPMMGKIKHIIQFSNDKVKYLEAAQCHEKCHQAVFTLLDFCYRAMTFVCQVDTKNPGPSCFCFTFN